MKYLRMFNENKQDDQISEYFIELFDSGYRVGLANNYIVAIKNVDTSNNFEFKCIITHENIGCERDMIAWNYNIKNNLNDFEKDSISKFIEGCEKFIISNDEIEELRIRTEYRSIFDPYDFSNNKTFRMYAQII